MVRLDIVAWKITTDEGYMYFRSEESAREVAAMLVDGIYTLELVKIAEMWELE